MSVYLRRMAFGYLLTCGLRAEFRATIPGRIRDASGGAVSGANVQAFLGDLWTGDTGFPRQVQLGAKLCW